MDFTHLHFADTRQVRTIGDLQEFIRTMPDTWESTLWMTGFYQQVFEIDSEYMSILTLLESGKPITIAQEIVFSCKDELPISPELLSLPVSVLASDQMSQSSVLPGILQVLRDREETYVSTRHLMHDHAQFAATIPYVFVLPSIAARDELCQWVRTESVRGAFSEAEANDLIKAIGTIQIGP